MADKLIILRNVMLAGILGIAAACSDGEETDNRLPEGKYPLTFTASGLAMPAAPATRATADGTWTGGEEVAVQVVGEDEVKRYVSISSGDVTTLEAASGVTPFFWQANNEEKTIRAWCSAAYSATLPENFEVKSDQSANGGGTPDGYHQSDFLYAAPTEISFAGTKKLVFKHLPVKVTVNLKHGDGVAPAEVQNAVVGIVSQSTTSGRITYGDTGDDVSVAQVPAGTGLIIPKRMAAATDGYQQTVQALLVPQQMRNEKFIKVEAGGNTYYYTPANDADGNLESGNCYQYNITVTKTGLNVAIEGDEVWQGGSTNIETTENIYEYQETDLKPGDYFYRTDAGDWETSDGGLRSIIYKGSKMDEIKIKDDVGPDASKGTLVGIVFWVGDPTSITPANAAAADIEDKSHLQGDATLKNFHPGCTHGLVVSLQEEESPWQQYSSFIQYWLGFNLGYTINGKQGNFLPVRSDMYGEDPLNNIQGFNNTKAIEKFNGTSGNSRDMVNAVKQVVDYRSRVDAPDNSSDWYLPSTKELALLCGGDVSNIYNNNSGSGICAVINLQLEKISEANELSGMYWSSVEGMDDSGMNACIVNFALGAVNDSPKNAPRKVRPVLAF